MEKEDTYQERHRDPVKINRMPDKKTLEVFLEHGEVRVCFNRNRGVFEWIDLNDMVETLSKEYGITDDEIIQELKKLYRYYE